MCKKLDMLSSLYVPSNYEQTARNLYEKASWKKFPIDIRAILHQLQISFGSADFTEYEKCFVNEESVSFSIQGMIRIMGDNLRIYYNQNLKYDTESNHKIRFTLAHELAHAIMHSKTLYEEGGIADLYQNNKQLDVNNKADIIEIEANLLANEILMPTTMFQSVYALLYKGIDNDPNVILNLSLFFDVSKVAVIERIKYLGL